MFLRILCALTGFYSHLFVCACEQYVEKQDLSTFISLTDDPSLDRKLDSARLHLRLEDDDIYLVVRVPALRRSR